MLLGMWLLSLPGLWLWLSVQVKIIVILFVQASYICKKKSPKKGQAIIYVLIFAEKKANPDIIAFVSWPKIIIFIC